jgi:hypothetical protein
MLPPLTRANCCVVVQCDIVTEITFVDGQGVVHVVPRHSAAGRGLCSGLGLLGIITELTLQMGVSAAGSNDAFAT